MSDNGGHSDLLILLIIGLSIVSGFFTGMYYTSTHDNLTTTQTSIVTIPLTKVITTTITTTIAAKTQAPGAAPILNTVYAYKSNVYFVSSSGTIVSVFLPQSYVSFAGEIVNFYSWFNPRYISYVYSQYLQYGYPKMPSGDPSNYISFSRFATSVFHYDSLRAKTIKYNPQSMMPLQVLYSHEGICGDYMHFWALLEIAEGRNVTLVDMFARDKSIGHAFIIDDEGYVIENNGHVVFNTQAAFILWYNYFQDPLVVTYFFANSENGITSVSTTTVLSVPLMLPTSIIKVSATATGILNEAPYTEIVYVNGIGNNISVTSIITSGKITYTKYIYVRGDVAVVITADAFGTNTRGYPYNLTFSYEYILPPYMKYRNILNYNNIDGKSVYTLSIAPGDSVIATSNMGRIIATQIINENHTVIGVITYTANVFSS